MTEEEAKTKWCPMTRTGLHAGSGGVAVNRSVSTKGGDYDVHDETRCLGSGCMMWAAERTHVETKDEQGFITGGRYERTGNGYCGFHDARGFGAIP